MKKIACLLITCCTLGAALVAAPPAFNLLSPKGGEHWKIGSRQTISWNVVPNYENTVYICLLGYNASNQVISFGQITGRSYKAGSFLWQVGSGTARKVTPGRYHVEIVMWASGMRLVATNSQPIYITSNLIMQR